MLNRSHIARLVAFSNAGVTGRRRRTQLRLSKNDINLAPSNISLTSVFAPQTYVAFRRPQHPFTAIVRALISLIHLANTPY